MLGDYLGGFGGALRGIWSLNRLSDSRHSPPVFVSGTFVQLSWSLRQSWTSNSARLSEPH